MLKKLVSIIVAVALSFPTFVAPAQADIASSLVAERRFNTYLIGQTVYYYRGTMDYPAVYVVNVDTYNTSALVRFSNGAQTSVPGSRLYSRDQVNVAQAAEAGVGLAILCLIACPSGSTNSGGSYGNDQQPNQGFDQEEYNRRNRQPAPEPEPQKPDTSVGCVWGDRAYGTCH
jgi:hypothetical protein